MNANFTCRNKLSSYVYITICDIIVHYLYYITGVAKLLDSPSHFLKFEIFCKSQLNTYLKGMQKVIKNTEFIFIENI